MKQVGEIPPVLISYTLFSPFHIFRRGRRPQRPLWPSDGTKIRAVKGLPFRQLTGNDKLRGFRIFLRACLLPCPWRSPAASHSEVSPLISVSGKRDKWRWRGRHYFFVRISYGKEIKSI
jgi:hypothetical protein